MLYPWHAIHLHSASCALNVRSPVRECCHKPIKTRCKARGGGRNHSRLFINSCKSSPKKKERNPSRTLAPAPCFSCYFWSLSNPLKKHTQQGEREKKFSELFLSTPALHARVFIQHAMSEYKLLQDLGVFGWMLRWRGRLLLESMQRVFLLSLLFP